MPIFEITQNKYDVILDLRYGSTNNFLNQQVYVNSLCFLHKDTLSNFEKAIHSAAQQGFRLKIFDAFRPQIAQEKLWSICPNPTYVADPSKGSNHTRGIAVDLTLIDENKNELDMGTPFDDFTPASHHGADLSAHIQANRDLLLNIMLTSGWDHYPFEWWHYQLPNTNSYPLLKDCYGMMTK
jgi:D-alanyl-D-alanine dipeptidase